MRIINSLWRSSVEHHFGRELTFHRIVRRSGILSLVCTMYVTYHASTSGFRRTRTNRLHSRMLDLATNIRIGRLGGILDHDSFSIPVRPNGMDHSIPMVCQSGKKE